MNQRENRFVTAMPFQHEVGETHFCVNKVSNCLVLSLENRYNLAVKMAGPGHDSLQVSVPPQPCKANIKNPSLPVPSPDASLHECPPKLGTLST